MAETKSTNKERLREITAGIEEGIKELFESDKYMQYLRTMSRFHRYSVNNQMLIHMQRPDATHVAGFNKWRDQFGRSVKRGEKGIKIIAPTPFKKKVEEMKLDPDTKAPLLDKDGNAIMEEKEIQIPMFKVVTVFDVSQTAGKPLPQLASDLTGDVKQYEVFMEALRRSSPVPMELRPIERDTDGYFSRTDQNIVIREGMSEVQTVSAAVHEIAHAKLHNYEKEREAAAAGDGNAQPVKPKDRHTEEVEAESISYAVCQYYGIQTGENSFGYIAGWSKGKELSELRASLETINKTASGLISDIDRHFAAICKERGIDLSPRQEVEQATPEPVTEQETAAPEPAQTATEPVQTADRADEALFLVDDAVYVHIAPDTDGHQYTAYLKEGMQFFTEGVIDLPGQTPGDAVMEAIAMIGLPARSIQKASLDLLEKAQERQEQPISEVSGPGPETASRPEKTYSAYANPRTTGIHDRYFIQAYDRTPGGLIPAEIIGINTPEKCIEITNQLNSGAITEAEARKLLDTEPEYHRYYITPEALGHGAYPLMDGYQLHETVGLNSYEDGRVQAYGYIDYPQPLPPEQAAEYGLHPAGQDVPTQEAGLVQDAQERLLVVDEDKYLHIQRSDEGYDYTIYNKETLREIDGGRPDMPDIPISAACLQVCDLHDMGNNSIKYASLDILEQIQEAEDRQQAIDVAEWERQNPPHPYPTEPPHKPQVEEMFEHLGIEEPQEEAPLGGGRIVGAVVRPYDPQPGQEEWSEPASPENAPEHPGIPSDDVSAYLPEHTLDEYPMPDPQLTTEEMRSFGYLDEDMLPLSRDRALELLEVDMTVYMLHSDNTEAMAFDAEDILAHDGYFGVERTEWEQSTRFSERIRDRFDRQEEREAAFLAHEGDCFALYQLRHDEEQRYLRYEPLERLRAQGENPMKGNYDLVYTAPLTQPGDTNQQLNLLWEQFNEHHPADYQSPSMSISDIVAVKQDGVVSCHYVDRFGFAELPGFFEKENPLKNAEMQVEDDYGMIDGIINNGSKAPTVAELEAQVKAGQQISLLDLANAVKQERGQRQEKKPSVLDQLRSQPKQGHKKSAPKKSAEREL